MPLDLHKNITLSGEDTSIELPLINCLRIFMVYMQKLLPDYYEAKQSNNIKDFFSYLEEVLETKDKTIIM